MTGISNEPIHGLPIAVVDIETTGLHPQGDRIVEVAVVRLEPHNEPQVVLETLVNPGRSMAATEIHGITEEDVRDAPTFRDIAPAVTSALSGCVFAAYNVYFDSKFMMAEMGRVGIRDFPPHLCLMYMRPLLGLGKRCSLGDACQVHGVAHESAHVAADDALASAKLWEAYLKKMENVGIKTFGDLTSRKSYKFMSSFRDSLLEAPRSTGSFTAKSRWVEAESAVQPDTAIPRVAAAEYWNALKAVLADLNVDPEEVRYLHEKRQSLDLADGEVRSLHARAFAGLLADVTDDRHLDREEADKIASLSEALRYLGWAPGDRIRGPGASRIGGKNE